MGHWKALAPEIRSPSHMPLVAKSLAGSQVSAHCRASHKLYTLAGVSARWQEAGGLPYAHASHLADRAWEVTLQSRSS